MDAADWKLDAKKRKRYPHFDAEMSSKAAEALANDPSRVARHPFYPFLLFNKHWNRFASKGRAGKPKDRPIRYAARADAYIFARYRHALSEKYEAQLTSLGLSEAVLAYRRLASPEGAGMCNIHFAKIAFEEVRRQQNCCVIALDISGFFESLDHERLKALWARLLGVSRLPDDHFHVFESITKYAVVDKEAAYERLGHFGVKGSRPDGTTIKGYLTEKSKVPIKLCTGAEFRQNIAGGNGQPSIIEKNLKSFGIPQGAPISDLLANLYLIDFDVEVKSIAASHGGRYFRYSDDILVIVPVEEHKARDIERIVRAIIRRYGTKLLIKEEKSAIIRFVQSGLRQSFHILFDGQSVEESEKRKRIELETKKIDLLSPEAIESIAEAKRDGRKTINGLEYLGFRFDGAHVFIRDSTLSNLWRKVKGAARRRARAAVRRFPKKSAAAIKSKFDYEELIQKFGRVEDFGEKSDEYVNWTFWTYARKSIDVFGDLGRPMQRQMSRYRKKIRTAVDFEIDRAARRRGP